MSEKKWQKTPLWMTLVILAVAIVPLCAYPWVVSATGQDSPLGALLWLFPAYVAATAVCAWICYADRPYLSWILLALLVLSDIGIWIMLTQT